MRIDSKKLWLWGIGSWILLSFLFSFLFVFASRSNTVLSTTHDIEEHINSLIKKENKVEEILRKSGIIIQSSKLKQSLQDVTELKNSLLYPNRPIQTRHLQLELMVREKAHKVSQRDNYLILLKIINKSNKYLAYRVLTQKTSLFVECKTGAPIKYHAFLLAPKAKVIRREGCSSVPNVSLKLQLIQVVTMLKPSYLLLGRLTQPIGLPPRLVIGHKSILVPMSPCVIPMKYSMDKLIMENPSNWFKFIHFYATHDCETEMIR